MNDYTKEDEELYRPVYTAVENVLVDEFGIGTVGLSDEVAEAVLTVVIGWLAEHDRQVKAEAWAEGYVQGARDNERDMEPADNPYLNGDNK